MADYSIGTSPSQKQQSPIVLTKFATCLPSCFTCAKFPILFVYENNTKKRWPKISSERFADVQTTYTDAIFNRALLCIENKLLSFPGEKPLSDYHLPSPDRSLEQDDDSLPREIAAEYSYNTAELQERLTTNERSLTQDQRHIYDELLAYVARAPDDTIVFLDAPGGTGKTYCSIFFLIKYDRKATLLSQSLLRESQQHFSSAAKQLTPSSSYLSTSVATSVPRVPFRKTQRELDFSPWPKWRLGRMHYGEQKSSRGIRQIPPRYSKQRLTHGRSASNTGRRL